MEQELYHMVIGRVTVWVTEDDFCFNLYVKDPFGSTSRTSTFSLEHVKEMYVYKTAYLRKQYRDGQQPEPNDWEMTFPRNINIL